MLIKSHARTVVTSGTTIQNYSLCLLIIKFDLLNENGFLILNTFN